MSSMKVGIIGTGSISSRHADAFRRLPGVEIAAACSTTRERAEAFAAKYEVPRVFTDYRPMLDAAGLDAVCVTTWNNTHAPISVAALKAGKHVLCEKPMALNATEAEEMLCASHASGKTLMIGMCRRFSEQASALRQFIAQGDLGDIYYAKTGYVRRWGNPGGWFSDRRRSGGGPVIDLGVHIIDLVRYLAGGPKAVTVSASVFSKLGMRPGIRDVSKYVAVDYSEHNDVEDGAAALIRFDNGMTLAVEVSWVMNIKEERMYLELYGDRAGAQLYPEFELYSNNGPYLTDTRPLIDQGADDTQRDFDRQAEHFITCVREGATCISPAEEGLEMMRVLDAIYESGRTGREITIRR